MCIYTLTYVHIHLHAYLHIHIHVCIYVRAGAKECRHATTRDVLAILGLKETRETREDNQTESTFLFLNSLQGERERGDSMEEEERESKNPRIQLFNIQTRLLRKRRQRVQEKNWNGNGIPRPRLSTRPETNVPGPRLNKTIAPPTPVVANPAAKTMDKTDLRTPQEKIKMRVPISAIIARKGRGRTEDLADEGWEHKNLRTQPFYN